MQCSAEKKISSLSSSALSRAVATGRSDLKSLNILLQNAEETLPAEPLAQVCGLQAFKIGKPLFKKEMIE